MTRPVQRRSPPACPEDRRRCLQSLLGAGLAAVGLPAAAQSPWDGARAVSGGEVLAAMRRQQAQGYPLQPIANAVRLQVGVFLDLCDRAAASDALRRPLRVGHREWFDSWLTVTGVAPQDAPNFVTVPFRYGEDFLLDYRMENVIARVEEGPAPRRAVNVKAGWPATPGAPKHYSYEDRSASPVIEATHEQVNSYRILDYGELIVYDDIRGVTGRATSGPLGLIFSVIGKASAVQTRFAMAADGTQVSRTTAHKGLTITQTVTIDTEGRVLQGLPEGRGDLEAIEQRLMMPLRVVYVPMDHAPVPPP